MVRLGSGLAWVGLLLATGALEAGQERRFEFSEVHMGSDFELVFYATDEIAANQAATAAFQRIGQIDDRLSDYRKDSEVNRWCQSAGTSLTVPLGNDLYFVMSRAQQLAKQTGGAFDVTVGPYTKLWRRAGRRKELPTADRLAAAGRSVGYQFVRLDHDARAGQLTQQNMRIDLGGIAKGYALDQALDVLRQRGIERAMVNGSGDIAVGAPPPGSQGWRIALGGSQDERIEQQLLSLANAAIATSGDQWQHVTIDGQRYSHIIDPRTGVGLTVQRVVTIVAEDGVTADSLASAISVLGPEKGLSLLKQYKHVAARIIERTSSGNREHKSAGFDNLPRVRLAD